MHAIRRPAAAFGALVAASLLAAAPASAAAPANAPGNGNGPAVGSASAVTARLGLDIRLLNSTVDVPVDVTLNSVQAPGSQDNSMLTADVNGVGGPDGPLTLVQAKLGHSSATADRNGSQALVDLVNARVNLPGLLGMGLITLDEVHAQADCPAGGQPSAQVDVLGDVGVLGRTVSLSAAGPTLVSVPGVGKVSLWLSKKAVSSHAAAATALDLQVSVNPLQLNVAEVTGEVELAAVSCHEGAGDPAADPSPTATRTPDPTTTSGSGAGTGASTPATGTPVAADPSSSGPTAVPVQPADTATPAAGTTRLAETGGGEDAPMIGGVALVLVGAGAAGVFLARRRRS